MKNNIKRIVIIFIGQFIAATAFTQILIPNQLVAVGIGGMATVIHNLAGFNIQLILLLLSLPIILWAFFKYEKKQVLYVVFCFGLFTLYTGFTGQIMPEFNTDPIIAAITGGLLFGIGSGIVLKEKVSNSPEAIVGLYLKETRDIKLGHFFLVLNTVVIFSSILYADFTMIIYSLISTYVASKVTDYVVVGTQRNYVVDIMSDSYLDITDFIQKKLKRGVTFTQSLDTSDVRKKMMIKTVVTNTELVDLKNYIKSLDDDSFVYVTESVGIIGGGFSS